MTLGVAAQPSGPRGVPQEQIVVGLRSSGVPRRFEECRLATFTRRRGLAAALEAAEVLANDDDGRGLLLSGPPGTGKTHLAVGIMAARLGAWLGEGPAVLEDLDADGRATRVTVRRRLDLRFLVVPTFLDRLRAGSRYTDRDDPLPALFDADLVVLDDLGAQKDTDWASERLYVLVNERYNRVLPTIVTSNHSADELAERGYAPVVSRLLEGSDLIRIEATDYRVRGGA